MPILVYLSFYDYSRYRSGVDNATLCMQCTSSPLPNVLLSSKMRYSSSFIPVWKVRASRLTSTELSVTTAH